MKTIQKYWIITLCLLVVGFFLVCLGGSEVSEARETENAMLLAEGYNDEFGGVTFLMISLIVMVCE